MCISIGGIGGAGKEKWAQEKRAVLSRRRLLLGEEEQVCVNWAWRWGSLLYLFIRVYLDVFYRRCSVGAVVQCSSATCDHHHLHHHHQRPPRWRALFVCWRLRLRFCCWKSRPALEVDTWRMPSCRHPSTQHDVSPLERLTTRFEPPRRRFVCLF